MLVNYYIFIFPNSSNSMQLYFQYESVSIIFISLCVFSQQNRRLDEPVLTCKRLITVALGVSVIFNIFLITLLLVSNERSWNTNLEKPIISQTTTTKPQKENVSTERHDLQQKQASKSNARVDNDVHISTAAASVQNCQTSHPNQRLFDNSNIKNIFSDLRKYEITTVYDFLKSQGGFKVRLFYYFFVTHVNINFP